MLTIERTSLDIEAEIRGLDDCRQARVDALMGETLDDLREMLDTLRPDHGYTRWTPLRKWAGAVAAEELGYFPALRRLQDEHQRMTGRYVALAEVGTVGTEARNSGAWLHGR